MEALELYKSENAKFVEYLSRKEKNDEVYFFNTQVVTQNIQY